MIYNENHTALKHKNWIFISIAIAMTLSFIPAEFIFPPLIAVLGLFFGLFLILFISNEPEDGIFLFNIFILAFLWRVIAALFLYHFVFLHNGTGLLGDSWSYSDNGFHILRFWKQGIKNFNEIAVRVMPFNTAGNLGSYDVWNAMIYSFAGRSPLSVIFINSLAASLTSILVYSITLEIYDKKAAKFSAILTCFWPSAFFWSIQNLKEPISAFLVCLLIWVYVRLKKQFRFYLVFIGVLAFLALKEFRGVALIVFIVALSLSFLLPIWKSRKIACLVLIMVLAMIYFLNEANIKIWISKAINERIGESLLDAIYKRRSYQAYGGSAYLANFDFRDPLKFLLYLPVGLLVAWLAPFPWQWGSILQITTIPEMLVYYALLFYLIAGIKYIINHKMNKAGIIVNFVFIMQLVLAVAEGNIGTLFRHRAMILPLIFILASIGFAERRKTINGA
jgi:hypothetical protein